MLFRKEVIDAKRQRLWGDVILIQPLNQWLLTGLIALLVLGTGTSLAWGSYARTEIARGYLVPDAGMAEVHAMRAGTIEEVFVAEGESVAKGQPLLQITATHRDGEGQSVAGRQLALLRERQALLKQRIEHARASAEDRDQQLKADIAGLKVQIEETAAQLILQEQLAASAQESLQSFEPLLRKNYIADVEYERQHQAVLIEQAKVRRIRQTLTSLKSDLERAKLEREALPSEAEESVRGLKAELANVRSRQAQIEGESKRTLTAPIAGRVTALQASAGRLANPQIPLMTILPKGAELEAEVYVRSRAMGFVEPGQSVRLLYDAFPYQRFGSHDGEIFSVTKTIFAPGDVNAPFNIQEPVYRVVVKLGHQHIDAYGDRVPLQAGMTLQANIMLDRRTLLAWIFEPFYAATERL